MKQIDDSGLFLCRAQARIFEASADALDCSSAVFIRRFMNSLPAKRMDGLFFIYEACDETDVFDEINEEYGKSNYGSVKYSKNELHWIGYIYRYWAYTYEKSSKQIYKIMKPDVLRGLYFPYHSLDPAQAIERIYEANNFKTDDLTARGVEILREITKRNNSIINASYACS